MSPTFARCSRFVRAAAWSTSPKIKRPPSPPPSLHGPLKGAALHQGFPRPWPYGGFLPSRSAHSLVCPLGLSPLRGRRFLQSSTFTTFGGLPSSPFSAPYFLCRHRKRKGTQKECVQTSPCPRAPKRANHIPKSGARSPLPRNKRHEQRGRRLCLPLLASPPASPKSSLPTTGPHKCLP